MSKIFKCDRFIPEEGLKIGSKLFLDYKDINDVDPKFREEIITFFENDEAYQRTNRIIKESGVNRGSKIGRRYGTYTWIEEKFLGGWFCIEYLDNPDGYGEGDFYSYKIVMPEYRWSTPSRFLATNLLDALFLGELMNRVYSYIPVFKAGEWWDIWGRCDERVPCFGKFTSHDGPDTQKYMSVKKVFKTDEADVLLVNYDAKTYREMDLVEYFMKQPGRSLEYVNAFITSIKEASEKMKVIMGAKNEL